VQIKIVIVGALLVLALGITSFFAVETLQDMRDFQQQNSLAMAGNVYTIRPWMTIPYISHTYHVPESYLYRVLNLAATTPYRHITLQALSIRYHRSVDELIRKIQLAIQAYRRLHPPPRHRARPVLRLGSPDRSVWERICKSYAGMGDR